ncbi:AP-3 complex subunit beta [Coemansia sp. IMI 209128]|nr:AP-3 complex subunit beta [Coemansia sp. RSA 2530]KAJ2693252.1 AP-3 complex subunit beta [Coemansia sp. IMI 209128]
MAEYLSKAMALAQDAAKLSMRFSEGLVDNALEFGLDTPGSFYDNAEYKLALVRKELGSGSDKDKLVAMKRLLAAVAKGHDASEHFADVVKNVASGNLEVRRLVYIYLLRYAEQEQDLALLSVNTFQRDLGDSNQVIRAMALRVMSSIRVPVISPIVVLAVRKLALDRSPHVRKTAALAVTKLVRLDAGLREELVEIVETMLRENSPLAVGSVIRAFCAVCPTRYDMVHGQFRRWCVMLADLDEWGQVELVKLLVAYARTQFAKPVGDSLDADHALLLRSVQPLMQSRNSAVVMSAVSAFCHLAPQTLLPVVARPLVRLLKAGRESAYVVLTNIQQIARHSPAMFSPYVRSFYVAAGDPPFTRRLKLQILAAIVSPKTVNMMVVEVAGYTQSLLTDIAVGAAGVLLACARSVRESVMDCFASLLLMLDDARPEVSGAAMQAVCGLLLDGTVRDLQDRTMTLYDIVCFLVRKMDGGKLTDDGARACVVGLVCAFMRSKFGSLHALEVLRRGARSFKDEGAQTKMQLLELSACLMLAHRAQEEGPLARMLEEYSEKMSDIHAYLFTLARYDVDFDVRDRARMLRALCPLPGDEAHSEQMPRVLEIANELMAASSDNLGQANRRLDQKTAFTIGSLSLTVDRPMSEYAALPEWPTVKPPSVDRGTLPGTRNVGGGKVDVTSVTTTQQPNYPMSRAINIAGISGRAQPYSSGPEYSTPRSAADHDDLDAFLNSADDSSERVVHVNPRTAFVFQQSEESSESDISSSESESESSGLESSASSEERQSTEEEDSGESSDDERSPFTGAKSDSQPSLPSGPSVAYTGFGGRRGSEDEQAHPLMDGTSQHWQ